MIVNGVSVPRPRNYLSVNYHSKHCLIQKIVCKILVIQLSWQTKLSKVRCCQLLQKLKYILECTKDFLSGSSYLSLESCQSPDPEDLARPENISVKQKHFENEKQKKEHGLKETCQPLGCGCDDWRGGNSWN